MVKQKKKRNKAYTGVDAKTDRPSITRVSAVNRNKVSQWWFDHKRVAKPTLIGTGIAALLAALILQIASLAGA